MGIDVVQSRCKSKIAVYNANPSAVERILSAFFDSHILFCGDGSAIEGILASFQPDLIICTELGFSRVLEREFSRSLRAIGNAELESRPAVRSEPIAIHNSLAIDARETPKVKTRHREVLLCLYRGLTSVEIARHIGVSPRTVKGYLSELFVKFDVTNRTELVGLISDMDVVYVDGKFARKR